jgi:cytochrome c oxidase cbb3-type subunit I/II
MSTFEGPLLSIKSVSALGHYTDWIVGHVHSGAIGWNYMFAAGMLYYLVPRLWKTEIYSEALSKIQFWMATLGLLLYYVSMVVAGITQGLMWRAVDDKGQLVYPNFMETVDKIVPMYWIRLLGGILVFISIIIMLYNIYRTIKAAKKDQKVDVFQAPALNHSDFKDEKGHRKLEGLTATFSVLAGIAVLVGTVVEFLPAFLSKDFIEVSEKVKPYTPLEVAGRDIYVREGCYNCHSQMIRPMVSEYLRYGKASEATESMYDHPFQWGSKRTGPDLARIGNKYPDSWHYFHMLDPRKVTPGSIMPEYTWLFGEKTDYVVLRKKLRVLKALGVPYTDDEIANASEMAKEQARMITENLKEVGVPMKMNDKQIIALIAYLQRLGADLAEEK